MFTVIIQCFFCCCFSPFKLYNTSINELTTFLKLDQISVAVNAHEKKIFITKLKLFDYFKMSLFANKLNQFRSTTKEDHLTGALSVYSSINAQYRINVILRLFFLLLIKNWRGPLTWYCVVGMLLTLKKHVNIFAILYYKNCAKKTKTMRYRLFEFIIEKDIFQDLIYR